jgi:multiple sugar transport system ATP-binding protein
MLDGRLQQLDTPRAIYARPANLFVAGFIGSPPMNLVVGSVVPGDGGHDALAVDVGGARLPLSRALLARCRPLADFGDVAVGFRPEHLRLCGADAPGLAGTVNVVEALGAEILVHVDVDVTRVDIAASISDERAREELGAELAATAATTVVARLDPDTPIDKGDSVRLAVDPDRLHLFDPVSGASLLDG